MCPAERHPNLPSDFDDLFRRATGSSAYGWQRALAREPRPPSVVAVPTGSGKTAGLILAWLFQTLVEGRGPRRLVYALPMRTLVEQTADVALGARNRLGLTPEELPIHILMGGAPQSDWRERPERPQILLGTIDMLLSRALNRGYAESRFQWPVAFGLLNADCRWVLDEVQLMGPARATTAQLDGLRHKVGAALPCQTTWVSATVDREALVTVDRPELGPVLTLPPSDRDGPLAPRLEAVKRVARLDFSSIPQAARPKALAEAVLDQHTVGTRTLVVFNTVARARATAQALRRAAAKVDQAPSIVLLHSRFRPVERAARMTEALAEPEGKSGTIVVATQVVEAGVDMSSRTLVTELAPFSSVVQRLGRCNRAGEFEVADVLWADPGALGEGDAARTSAAPYPPADLDATRQALLDLEGQSLSPTALGGLDVPESREEAAVLRRRDLLDLFDTSPDLSGLDVDVAPFIRDDDERDVSVFFREVEDLAARQLENEPRPEPDELVRVPLAELSKDRSCWRLDHVEGVWLRTPYREIPPGAEVLLAAGQGGYSEMEGWNPGAKSLVPVISRRAAAPLDGFGRDRLTEALPCEISAHLHDVAEECHALAAALVLSDRWRQVLHAAGALHDVGKAHPVFQRTLLRTIDEPDAADRLWAKGGAGGGRHERPYFRHELASALALEAIDGQFAMPEPRVLISYLVAAHHGKVRLSIRPAPDEEPPPGAGPGVRFALGIVDGDRIPAVSTPLGELPAVKLDLSPMELGGDASWTDRAVGLRDQSALGPFRLAFLEALLRVADWRASARERQTGA